MIAYHGEVTRDKVKNFINYRKNPRESDPIPKNLPIIQLRIRRFMSQFNVSIQKLLDRLGINIVWDVKKTYALLLVHLIFLITLANSIVKLIYTPPSKGKTESRRKDSINEKVGGKINVNEQNNNSRKHGKKKNKKVY